MPYGLITFIPNELKKWNNLYTRNKKYIGHVHLVYFTVKKNTTFLS